MICEPCGKNQATVHLTEIVNDQMSELHLCEQCAKEKGAMGPSQHFGLADLLAGLVDIGLPEEGGKETGAVCPNCKFSYADFKKIGRLGCSSCYDAFNSSLTPLLKKIQGGSTHHLGKTTQKVDKEVKPKVEMQELQARLQKAIQREEFEEAARLRDMIRIVEKKLSDKDKGKEDEVR